MFSLKNKVAVVTGGNGGIGKGIAVGLANAGASIAIVGRNLEKNQLAKEEIISTGVDSKDYICDVSDPNSVNTCVSKIYEDFGHIDILVNNAGTSIRTKEPQELSPEDWKTVMDTNLSSVHYFSSAVIDKMKDKGQGKIINIGSMMTIFGAGHASVYAASKGGVVQYTKSCAIAWAKYGIQVNSILPGYITTNMTDGFKKHFPKDAELVTSRIPAERWGKPEDFAGIAMFLASPLSDYVTGAFIPVDGGYSVR